MKKRFFILDGSSLMYRAFYALPLLESASGQYTNAIYGFSNMLIKLLGEWKPDYLVIAFDKGKKTFRNEKFEGYKGTRKPTPPELLSQIPLLHEMAEAWGIAFRELAGYEADDIIGTLSAKAVENGCEAYVVTGDKDALQLVRPDLNVLFTKKGISEIKRYDVEAFEDEYEGLSPIQLIDLKGLMGDTSDNIPGVPNVGPKTAMKLIAAYGSVEEVLLHVEEVSGKKLKDNLKEYHQQALLSKELATICLEAPVEYEEESFSINIDGKRLQDFYSKYGIKSMLKAIEPFCSGSGSASAAAAEYELPEYKVLSEWSEESEDGSMNLFAEEASRPADGTLEELKKLSKENGRVYIAFDGSTTAVAAAGGSFFLMRRNGAGWSELETILADETVDKYLHGLKSFYHAQLQLKGRVLDMELLAYLVNPAQTNYGVENLVAVYCSEMQPFTEEKPDKKKPADEQTERLRMQHRLVWQADAICRMAEQLENAIRDREQEKLYWEMELPLVKVLSDMEHTGIYLNRNKLAQQAEKTAARLQELEKEIYSLAGIDFNINSPKQLGEVLFERLGLPASKKTKTGYSTNAEVLEKLSLHHPIIEKILSYRLWNKLKSTYLDGLGSLADNEGRIHTSFNQTVTATGRLSSSDPNLQNIPVRTEEGRQIRELFEPGKGFDCLLSADYSQIELRVLAAMSGDEGFIKAFNDGEDIHARTAAEVFDVPIQEVTPAMRRSAKAVNFGIVYGMSDYGLSQDLKISRVEAAGYIKSYFAKCPGIKAFIDKTVSDVHDKGYVTTMFNRRRDLPAIRSSNFNQRMLAERMAMNTPIQGTAADIIKLAMIKTDQALKEKGLKSRVLLQVHDELVLEAVNEEIPEVKKLLKDSMENIVKLSVPLSIDINVGKNWAEAK